jgi:hypothetical protein
LVFAVSHGVSAAEPGKTAPPKEPAPSTADKEPSPKLPDPGPPLVDNAVELKRLHPLQPVWLDVKQKRVVFLAEVCRASYELEFFVVMRGREYESVLTTDVRPSFIHAGLLALGALPGRPVQRLPKFEPASGSEVEIEVRWKDKEGKVRHARAQEWIRNEKTKKVLDANWVFAGSAFSTTDGGKRVYEADRGDFISVANVPTATLDLPIRSDSTMEGRLFEAFTERLPPKGTAVTVVLVPKVKKP